MPEELYNALSNLTSPSDQPQIEPSGRTDKSIPPKYPEELRSGTPALREDALSFNDITPEQFTYLMITSYHLISSSCDTLAWSP